MISTASTVSARPGRAQRRSIARASLAAWLAFGGILAWPRKAEACFVCCTPYTYLQFCCYGCLNVDFVSFIGEAQQLVGVVANLAQFVNQANEFRQQLTNDYIILTTIGKQKPNIGSIVTQFAYQQGISWVETGANVTTTAANFQALYMYGETSNNLTQAPAGAYDMMKQDIRVNAATTMAYTGIAGKQLADDLADIKAIAEILPNTTDKREDIQANSRAREKLVALMQTQTTLLAQYVGIRSRNIAFQNQTDLSPAIIPTPP